jgi:hypothetical protein
MFKIEQLAPYGNSCVLTWQEYSTTIKKGTVAFRVTDQRRREIGMFDNLTVARNIKNRLNNFLETQNEPRNANQVPRT